MPLKVFVSSIFQELGPEREIAADIISELGLQPLLWEQEPAGRDRPSERLKQMIDESDAFVLIVWKDLHDVVEWEYTRALDRGIPRFIFLKRVPKIPSRRRLTNFLESAIPTYKEFRLLKELEIEVKRTVGGWLSTLVNPFRKVSYPELLRLGNALMEEPIFRLIDSPAVATILTGPRPFGDPSSDPADRRMFEHLNELRKKAIDGKFKYFTGTNLELTKRAIGSTSRKNSAFRAALCENLKHFELQSRIPGSQFRFACAPPKDSRDFQFVVVDNRFAIWWEDFVHPGSYVWSSGEDSHIANGFEELYKINCTISKARKMMIELGLV